MSGVTDGDRERVIEIIRQAMADEKWLPMQPYRLHVYRLAAALAEEREKARAPFMRFANECEFERYMPDLANRLRRIAEETA